MFLLLVSCKKEAPVSTAPPAPEKLVIPKSGAYTGAYIDFGDDEDDVTLEAIEDFEKLVGKHQAIIASSSYWGEQTFPTDNVTLIYKHGSVPLLYWSPWDKPYEEDRGPDRFSLTSIIAGQWDSYIDAWAVSAKEFGHPLFVSFGNEANGQWFPWSGCFYDADKIIPGSKPPKYTGPETYKKAYRYVVDRVRAKGATNVLWVWQAMNYSIPVDYWNDIEQYYPGAAYVDWFALSVYGQQYPDDRWTPFEPLLEWPYTQLCALDPNKPIMLAEWGIGEFPKSGSKAGFITEAFDTMKQDYPRLKAAIFWHERWQNDDGSYSNLRVNSSQESLDAYRAGVGTPLWIGNPIYNTPKK